MLSTRDIGLQKIDKDFKSLHLLILWKRQNGFKKNTKQLNLSLGAMHPCKPLEFHTDGAARCITPSVRLYRSGARLTLTLLIWLCTVREQMR